MGILGGKVVSHTGAFVILAVSAFTAAVLPTAPNVYAEGTHQMNEMQSISSSTDIYVDILNVGETINISVCDGDSIDIYDTNGTPRDLDDDMLVDSAIEFTPNLDCEQPLPNPITDAHKYTPASTGTYRIDVDSTDRYDFSVTANPSINPNPTTNSGRVWSYMWRLSAIETDDPQEYPESTSTDADLYSLVPAPTPGENFVWKLDLNNFAGGSYRLMANSIGLDAPYSGVSAWLDESNVTPEYPIYLSYPAKAGTPNSTEPVISGLIFRDDENEDNTFSPGTTSGTQDSGEFRFTSNVNNATYAITVDTNKDGQYGTGDRLLLGNATSGLNTVAWDGNYANGTPVPEGNYNAKLELRIGEFHFVARDVEASGGTHNGLTWANGLTIYKATSASTSESTRVFWDDLSVLRVLDQDTWTLTDQTYADATSNLPNGAMSGSTTDSNNDGKADGFHTWGDFEDYSMGDENMIDTYTYGEVDAKFTSLSVSTVDGTDDDGISSGVESGALNDGDGNGDGQKDHLQSNVASLPNSATGGAYTTLEVTGCEGLSNVDILTESEVGTPDAEYEYPVGLLDFEVNCLTPGATANIRVIYDKVYDTSNWQARKFIGGEYGDIAGATFATANIGGAAVTTLNYSVTDGGDLDADGIVNGVIVDPAGPGAISNGAVSDAVAAAAAIGAPNTGFGKTGVNVAAIIAVFSMIAAIMAGIAYSRQQQKS